MKNLLKLLVSSSKSVRNKRVGSLKVLAVLLGVPLLPLLAVLQLGEQRLPIRLVQLHDPFQFLHEEQLQHPLVGVQVSQLEELPLQNVVVSVGGGERVSCERVSYVKVRCGSSKRQFCLQRDLKIA